MTKSQSTMRVLMADALKTDRWDRVPSNYAITIRHTVTIDTPDYARSRYPSPTYDRHLFVSLSAKGAIIGDASAPWVRRRDREVSYWFAFLLLEAEHPFAVLAREANLVAARRAATRERGVRP